MRVMTVGADSRIGVPSRQCLLMDAVKSLDVLFFMALLAGGVILKRKIAQAVCGFLRMGKSADGGMAGDAGDFILTMDAAFKNLFIDGQRKHFPAGHFDVHSLLCMAAEAGLIGGCVLQSRQGRRRSQGGWTPRESDPRSKREREPQTGQDNQAD